MDILPSYVVGDLWVTIYPFYHPLRGGGENSGMIEKGYLYNVEVIFKPRENIKKTLIVVLFGPIKIGLYSVSKNIVRSF